jgi:hypothetical protein
MYISTLFCTTVSPSVLHFPAFQNHHNFHFFQNKMQIIIFISTNHGISSSSLKTLLMPLPPLPPLPLM